ncbi:MAG: type II secretion system ATPase GspE [Bacteriovoracales bacterium]|nr:type II secretion system ATPase GspE [Bacteriovoracales bacterium]
MDTSNFDKLSNKGQRRNQKIGELLVEYTSLSQEQLDEALRIQEDSGMPVGQILIKKNYLHPHDITKILCLQIGITYLEEINVDEINPLIAQGISINYAKHHNILPIYESPAHVTVAVADPFKSEIFKDIHNIFQKEVIIVCTSPLKLQDAINRVYERGKGDVVDSIEDEFEDGLELDGPIDILDAGADEAPVIRFVNSIIFRAVKEKSSDIHVEPYEKDVIYRFRINGVMKEILRQPIRTHAAVSSRIKVMAKLDIAEKRLPQDGRIKVKIAGKDIDIRLSTVPVQTGERIVMRVLEKDQSILSLGKLGFTGQTLEKMDDLANLKHGVFYVSGPTGHGKTTTLFAMLDRINDPSRMIITVEDPVEYEIQGISQIQVNHKIDLSFAKALRSILRQNPDVIMVGETRDLETAEMAINASLTGHMVFSTIHTNDAPSCPTRLIDMGVQPFLISSALAAVLAQRLIRTLCPECKEEYDPPKFELDLFDIETLPPKSRLYKARGCAQCAMTGYGGRTSVSELMILNDEIRKLILDKADSGSIKKAAIQAGMASLLENAKKKIFLGITTFDEVNRAINAEFEGQ